MITGHGDDLYKYPDIRINFSSNIYGHADLSGLKKHLSDCLDMIGNYPEPEPYALEEMIAAQRGIPKECIMVTNGATEAVYLIAQTFRNGICEIAKTPYFAMRKPTFSEYEDASRIFGYKETDIECCGDEETLIWFCNPNNPTGEVITDEYMKFMDDKRRLIIVDQSYEDYTLADIPKPSEMLKHDNVILLHSMTKAYSVPGLRLGYVIANEHIIERLRSQSHPWAVNALAIEAGKYLVGREDKSIPDVKSYLAETQRLRYELNNIKGVCAYDTQTNFFLVRTDRYKAAELKEIFALKYGILIRDASNFNGLDSRYIRIATQKNDENDALVKAFSTLFNI